jgi:5-oxoprolinase (ATP-hydrolysing)
VLVLTSAGGLVPAGEVAERPASLLLSGPAGGVRAAAAVAAACGWPDALTFDMGGTSTDVCLVRDGAPDPAAERTAAGLPVRLPSLGIHTIGAGGGSLASIDPGWRACAWGRRRRAPCRDRRATASAGTDPTVTDADLVLGPHPRRVVAPGLGALDAGAAAAALAAAGVDAEGVVAVVDAGMERALRSVSVARGVDPAGAGPRRLRRRRPPPRLCAGRRPRHAAVIVPPRAGVLSAVGLLCSPVQRDLVRSWPHPDDHDAVEVALVALADEARAPRRRRARAGAGRLRRGGGEVETSLDCRYAGQSHEITVPSVGAFPAEHRARNGYERPGAPIEVVALRARASVPAPIDVGDLPTPRHARRWSAPPSWPRRTARSGWPRGGGPTPARSARSSSHGWSREPRAGRPPDPDLPAHRRGRGDGRGAAAGASSPNIKERADCSAALFTPDGELVVQAEHIPVHLGSMPPRCAPPSTRSAPGGWRPGEQIILNDPYAGGTHLNDVTLVAPCSVAGRLVGWVANRAHHADLGGMVPGSIPPEATEIHQEGLRIPPVRPDPRGGGRARRLLPHPRRAQGRPRRPARRQRPRHRRLAAMADAPLDEVTAYGERRMRPRWRRCPDGTWRFADVLDSSGPGPDQQQPAAVVVAVTVAGDA